MVLIAQVGAPVSPRHRRGIEVGGADAEVGRPPVGTARRGPIGATRVPDPVVAGRSALGQDSLRLIRERHRQPRRFVASAVQTVAPDIPGLIVMLCSKELSEVRLHGEAGVE